MAAVWTPERFVELQSTPYTPSAPPICSIKVNLKEIVHEAKRLSICTAAFTDAVESSKMAACLSSLTDPAPHTQNIVSLKSGSINQNQAVDRVEGGEIDIITLRQSVTTFILADAGNISAGSILRNAILRCRTNCGPTQYVEELKCLLPVLLDRIRTLSPCSSKKTASLTTKRVPVGPERSSAEVFACLSMCLLYFEILRQTGGCNGRDEITNLVLETVKMHFQITLAPLVLKNGSAGPVSKIVGSAGSQHNDITVLSSILKDFIDCAHTLLEISCLNQSQTFLLLSVCFEAQKLPIASLQTTAADVIVQVFATCSFSHEYLLSSLVSLFRDIGMIGQALRVYRMTVQGGLYLHSFTVLLLRVLQVICVANADEKCEEIAVKTMLRKSNVLRNCCFFLVDRIVRTCFLLDRSKDGMTICKTFVSDLCTAARDPSFPAAPVVIKCMCHWVGNLITGGRFSTTKKVDCGAMEFFACLLAQFASYLFEEEASCYRESCIFPESAHTTVASYCATDENICMCGRPCEQGSGVVCRSSCAQRFHVDCVEMGTSPCWNQGGQAAQWVCNKCAVKAVGASLLSNSAPEWLKSLKTDILDESSLGAALVVASIILSQIAASKNSSTALNHTATHAIIARRTEAARSTFVCRLTEKWFDASVENTSPQEHRGISAAKSDTRPMGNCYATTQVVLENIWTGGDNPGACLPLMGERQTLGLWRRFVCDDLPVCRQIVTRSVGILLADASQSTLRRSGVILMDSIISSNPLLLESAAVIDSIRSALVDKSAKVRQRTLIMLNNLIEGSNTNFGLYLSDGAEATEEPSEGYLALFKDSPGLDESTRKGTNAAKVGNTEKLLADFLDAFSLMTNDKSPLVRGQCVRILGHMCMRPSGSHLRDSICLKLLERLAVPTETPAIQSAVREIFAQLWFTTENQRVNMGNMIEVVGSSGKMFADDRNLLEQIYEHVKTHRGLAYADRNINSWIDLLLEVFPSLRDGEGRQVLKALHTIVLFAKFRPETVTGYLKYLTHYLTHPLDSPVAKAICVEVANMMEMAAPFIGLPLPKVVALQKKLCGLLDCNHTLLIRAAIGALCALVQHVTFDYEHLLQPYITNSVSFLSSVLEGKEAQMTEEMVIRIQRLAFQIACFSEKLNLSTYVLDDLDSAIPAGDNLEDTRGGPSDEGERCCKGSNPVPRSVKLMKFSKIVDACPKIPVSDPVTMIFELLSGLFFRFEDEKLRTFLVNTQAVFLVQNRKCVRSRTVREVFASSLSPQSPATLQRAGCQGMYRLLKAFETTALSEGNQLQKKNSKKQTHVQSATKTGPMAVDCAQPLSCHLPSVLRILSSFQRDSASTISVPTFGVDNNCSAAYYALLVVDQLHRQGLVNPNDVIAPIFCVSLCAKGKLSFTAARLFRQVVDSSPKYFLNNMTDCIQAAFVFLLAHKMVSPFEPIPEGVYESFAQVYAERCRKQRMYRERFVRVMCRQLEKCGDPAEMEIMLARYHDVCAGASLSKPGNRLSSSEGVMGEIDHLSLSFTNFAVTLLSRLPYTYESETLLVVHELSRYISLHALSAGPFSGGSDEVESTRDRDNLLMNSTAYVAASVLKDSLKRHYRLSASLCQSFCPEAPLGAEKPKYLEHAEDGTLSTEQESPLSQTAYIRHAMELHRLAATQSRTEICKYAAKTGESVGSLCDLGEISVSKKRGRVSKTKAVKKAKTRSKSTTESSEQSVSNESDESWG